MSLISKPETSSIALLEKSLSFKQLQINRLLDITQAINNNMKAADLYSLYKDIMGWQMGVKKLLLAIKNADDDWEIATSIGMDENADYSTLSEVLSAYSRLTILTEKSDVPPILSDFDILIPVSHKQVPIAYALIGGMRSDDDLYEQVKFITTITNIIAVALENKRLFKRQLEQERLKHEITLAAQMQAHLIPDALPRNERYELDGIYQPHGGVGGDYYDYIPLDEDQFIFCIADISGKGIAASLLMSNFQANLQSLIHSYKDPLKFIQTLNKTVQRITKGDKFITLFIGKMNLKTRELIYINAGHTPPMLWTKGEVHFLDKGCTILGAFKKLPHVEIGSMPLDEESLLVCFTDGLTDLTNAQGEFYDTPMLADFLATHHFLPARSFNDTLMQEVARFKGTQAFPDDISVLTCRIYK